jgi:hypothetical protein
MRALVIWVSLRATPSFPSTTPLTYSIGRVAQDMHDFEGPGGWDL